MELVNNKLRFGNFTSSEIYRLMGNGTREMTIEEKESHKKEFPKSQKRTIEDESILTEKALTYIREKNMERRLQRSIDSENNAKPLMWGKFCEKLVFDLIGTVRKISSTDTIVHPKIKYWSGTPDAENIEEDTVEDIKCPWTLRSFCNLVQPLYDGLDGMEAMNALRFGYTDKNGNVNKPHDDAEKYYWQLISNSILTGRKNASLIIYCPFESEIEIIKRLADGDENAYFITFDRSEMLPYIKDNGYYSNINIITFEVPKEDKKRLQKKILLAGKKLLKNF